MKIGQGEVDLADFVTTKYWSPKKLCQKFREFRETGVQKWNLKNPIFEEFGQNHESKNWAGIGRNLNKIGT